MHEFMNSKNKLLLFITALIILIGGVILLKGNSEKSIAPSPTGLPDSEAPNIPPPPLPSAPDLEGPAPTVTEPAIEKPDVDLPGTEVPDVSNAENDITAQGTIVLVDTTAIAFDGPVKILVRKNDGNEQSLSIPSMGLPLCAAAKDIADVFTLEAGQTIEVRGGVGSRGEIVPCESSRHYLRVVE